MTSSGNNLTVPVGITFASGFGGSKIIYGLAQTYSGSQSGWQTLGSWTPASATVLAAVSVNPTTGSGFGPQIFSAVYADPNGASDLQVVYLGFGTASSRANSCFVAYVQANNALYLFNDADTGLVTGSISEGGTGSLSNSQCTISSGGTVTPLGNNLTVPITITFATGFTGSKTVYGLAQSYSGAASGFQTLGAWTP